LRALFSKINGFYLSAKAPWAMSF